MKVEITEKKMTDVVVDSFIQCDKCKERIPTKNFEVFECKLVRNQFESYPEGTWGSSDILDLCQKCSDELIEILKENGFTPRVVEC